MAISVRMDRLVERDDTQLHRVRAAAALTAFSNALVVSLFGLVPAGGFAAATLTMSVVGLVFIAASLSSLLRVHGVSWRNGYDVVFLVGLMVIFVFQLLEAIRLERNGQNLDALRSVATLVIVCFVVGIARAWELIGGPSIGLGSEVRARFGRKESTDVQPADVPPAEQPEDAGS